MVEERTGIIKHMHNVRLAASRVSGIGWSIYDEQYRLHKARFPHGDVDMELLALVCFHSTAGYEFSR